MLPTSALWGLECAGACCRIGDICVSPFSVNWDCRQASWQQTAAGFPNECTYPAQNYGPADSFLYGQCQFTDVTPQQLALSDEVLAASASRSNELPIRNSVIQVRYPIFYPFSSERCC